MDEQKVIEFMDELIEAKEAIESLHHLSVLLMDGFKANGDEATARLLHCYYTYAVLLEGILEPCIDKVDKYLRDMQ